MKKIITLFICCCCCMAASAQNPRFYKDGRNKVNAVAPFLQPSGHTQIMYPPASFAVRPPSGAITSIFFKNHYLDQYSTTAFDYLYITLMQTTDTVFSNSNFYTGGTQVISGSYYAIPLASVSKDGWLELPLSTNFTYNSNQTLIVDIKYTSRTNDLNTWADSTAPNNPKVCTSTSTTATSGTLSRQWNHFGINVTPTSACSGPPTAGAAVSKRAGGCGAGYILDLTGNSAGTGQLYQWQSAPSAGGPFTNTGTASTSSAFTVTPTTNTWYRAAVTCGTNTAYSAPTILGPGNILPAGTYSINSNQPTGGTNYRSFNTAVEAMTCGIGGPVTFNVAPGCDTFFEQVIVPAIPNTSPVNRITVNGNGGKLSYRQNYTTANIYNYMTMRMDGVDYLTLDSLSLSRDTGSYYYGSYWNNAILHITNDANNLVIRRCKFGNTDTAYYTANYNNYGNGILVSTTTQTGGYTGTNCDTILIEQNTFYQCGIYAWGLAAPNQNKGNKILNNNFLNRYYNNYYYNGYGLVYLRGQDSAVVEGNFMEGRSYYSIYSGLDCSNTLISKNKIIDTIDYTINYSKFGIYDFGQATRIFNNIIDLKGTYTLYGIQIQNSSSSQVISNNTIRLSYTTPSSSYIQNGIYIYNNSGNPCSIKNNIITLDGSSSNQYSAAIRAYNTSITSDNNDFYTPNNNAVVVYNGSANNFYGSLAAWQTASGQDLNSYSLNPSFAAPSQLDYHPTNLLLDDKGVPVAGVRDDIIGITRSTSAPDIGAYEFGNIPYCPPPTNVAASSVTTTGAVLTWTAPPGISSFGYVLDQSAGNPATGGTPITGTTYTASNLAPYSTYYFHIRTNCAPGYSQWVTISFATGCLTPSAAISPAGTLNVCNGSGATLTAPAGTGFTYQWKKNGVNIPGATGSAYYANTSGNYTVQVFVGTCDSTTQVPVTVNMLPGASVTAGSNTTICQGGNVLLSANTGSGLTYQWQQNGTNISGATGGSYSATATGTYRVVVFNGTCTDTSGDVNVTVVPYPSAVLSPAGPLSFCDRQSTRLTAAQNAGYTYQWYRNGVAITGATNSYYDATISGSYTAVLSNGSCSTTTNAVSVTILPLPAANVTLSGTTTFCQGGTVTMTANSGTGLTYQWQQNNANIPGASSITYGATASGNYRVVVSNGLCSDTSANIPVTVIPYPSNVITPAGPVSFCDRQSRRLNAALNATYVYQWYHNGSPIPGATTSFHDATLNGTYYATISNSGCSITTNTVSVTVIPVPVATADAVGNTVFCNTGSVNIQANQGSGYTYQWMRDGAVIPGATSPNYIANLAGMFSVIVSNGQCSDTSVGVPVVFNAYPRPVITLNNGILSTTMPFATYQWNKNGLMIPFANNRDYVPAGDGNYVAVVGDTSGCLGSSNVITINSLGTGSIGKEAGITIYPNPATDVLYINSSLPAVMVSLVAADGQVVLSQRCTGRINIASFAAGVYSLKVSDTDGRLLKVEKVVKVR